MLPTKAWISRPETSRHASIRSARPRIGVSESVDVLVMPAAAGEVVDDEDLVAAGREAHRRGPAEVAVAAEDQDPHGGAA